MSSKTVVVGAGIAGITAAYFARKKGDDVILLELEECAGGLLKSETNHFGSFDYGTHIATVIGILELDSFLFSDSFIVDSNCFDVTKSGSYFFDTLSEISPFVNTTNLPAEILNPGYIELLSHQDGSVVDLESAFISHYGETLYHHVFKPVAIKFFGSKVAEVSASAMSFFDLNRTVAFDRGVSDRLKSIDCYNHKLGYHYPTKGVKKYYPRTGGIGFWVETLLQQAISAGVEFFPKTSVKKLVCSYNKVVGVETNSGYFNCGKLLWTLPSAFLSKLIPVKTNVRRPEFRNTCLFDFVFDKPLNSDCIYINVHQPGLYSGRITLYQNLSPDNSFLACTVECLGDNDLDYSVLSSAIMIELLKMGLIGPEHNCLFEKIRPVKSGFPLITTEMIAANKSLEEELRLKASNLTFLGRSPGRAFFMSDILSQAYYVGKNC